MWLLILVMGISALAAIGGSVEGGIVFVIGLIIIIGVAIHNGRVNSYDMSKVNHGKMNQDYGKSSYEIQRNLLNGKYDK